MRTTQLCAHDPILAQLPRDIREQLAAHPCAAVLQAIIEGRAVESGTVTLEKGLETFAIEPTCVAQLNNFDAHLHGGAYRSGWFVQSSTGWTEAPHLLKLLESLAQQPRRDGVNIRYSLGGFSYRYLAESPQELWQQVDQTTERITGNTPEKFGEIYREAKTAMTTAQALLEHGEDSNFRVAVPPDVTHDSSRLNLESVRAECASAQSFWTNDIEPRVMEIYRSLVSQGYAMRDFWT
jgi:hypothetical protein